MIISHIIVFISIANHKTRIGRVFFMSNAENLLTEARKFFVDPKNPDAGIEIGWLAMQAARAMGMIYAYGGDINKMPEYIQKQLNNQQLSGQAHPPLEATANEILRREASTRRFDHRFMGQIHPQGSKIGILCNFIAAYMNTNTIVKDVSLSEHAMEHEVLDWSAKLFGYDLNKYSGNIVSGGTTANIAAMWVAREKTIKKLRERKAYARGQDMVIVGSDMKHYSVTKAGHMLGDNMLVATAKSCHLKTSTDDVERILKICSDKHLNIAAIVGIAGETETGMIDDLNRLADLAEEYDTHFHVDAAYGGPYILTDRVKNKFAGIDRADSIVIDPHKLLFTPYPNGVILFKDKSDHALIQNGARYLQHQGNNGLLGLKEDRNFGLSARVEGSMGPHGVLSAWGTIFGLGEENLKVLLDHTIDLTQHALTTVSDSEFSGVLRPLHIPETNTLLLGIYNSHKYPNNIAEEKAIDVKNSLDQKGTYISVNESIDNGRPAFRTVYMHPYTEESDVDDMLYNLKEEVKRKFK